MKRYNLLQSLPCHWQSIYILSTQSPEIAQYEIARLIQQTQIEMLEKYTIESLADWDRFKQNGLNYDLLSPTKAYIIQLEKSGIPQKNFFNLNPGADELYIIQTPQFKHAFFEHLAKKSNCYWYAIYSPQPNELWNWLSRQLSKTNYQWTAETATWFQQQDELSFHHYSQLFEQIQLSYQSPHQLQLSELQKLIGHRTQNDWQALVEAWMRNDKAVVLEKCQRIPLQQDLTLLLWILNRHLQVWHALVMRKQSPQKIYQDFKIWNKQIPLFERSYPLLKIEKINKAICLLQEIDQYFKTYQYLPAQLKLQQLLLGYPYA